MVAKKYIYKQKYKARSEVCVAKQQVGQERFLDILRRGDEKDEVFKVAKKMARTNQDVVGEKYIRNDHGDLFFGDCVQ